jgi:hypothetical protein
MNVLATIKTIETAGAILRLNDERVRVWYPDECCRRELTPHMTFLRDHRDEVASLLRSRGACVILPPGVRLIEWNLKQPPVAIETCAVVTDPGLFARTTLEQLRIALAEPKRWAGWSVPQLIDRLGQVGVRVVVDRKAYEENSNS